MVFVCSFTLLKAQQEQNFGSSSESFEIPIYTWYEHPSRVTLIQWSKTQMIVLLCSPHTVVALEAKASVVLSVLKAGNSLWFVWQCSITVFVYDMCTFARSASLLWNVPSQFSSVSRWSSVGRHIHANKEPHCANLRRDVWQFTIRS